MTATAKGVELEGMAETLRALQGLSKELRPEANGELRDAAGETAGKLRDDLARAAAGSPTPQARLVARTLRVVRDRIPAVSIGGGDRVGRYGASADALLWGSEHGGHNFVAGGGGEYWIGPTVERFKSSTAIATFERAIGRLVHKWGLD